MAEKIKLGSNGNFGVKEGGTLAYNDENGVFKAIELASSRASSATYVAESGLIADAEVGVPRIDWTNGVGELLLEPQRRNLIPYSADFTQPDWTSASTATLSATTTIAPDGSQNAVKVTATAPSDQLAEVVPVTSGQTYTGSIWVRRVTGSGNITLIDVNNDFTIINPTSEWQRFSVTATATSTSGRLYVRISDAGDEVEVWGAQLEDNGTLGGGDYMTSYIPTNGTSVTRIADAVTGNSSLGQVINSSEGVLYFEGSALADDLTSRRITLNNGTTDRVIFQFQNSSNAIRGLVQVSSSPIFDSGLLSETITNNNKIAIKYKTNDFAVWINGVEVYQSSIGTIWTSTNLDTLSFNDGGAGNPFYGRIRELKVYDTALTDAELTTLTTI